MLLLNKFGRATLKMNEFARYLDVLPIFVNYFCVGRNIYVRLSGVVQKNQRMVSNEGENV